MILDAKGSRIERERTGKPSGIAMKNDGGGARLIPEQMRQGNLAALQEASR